MYRPYPGSSSLAAGPSHFSQLLQATGVYKDGDKPTTTPKPEEAVFPQAEKLTSNETTVEKPDAKTKVAKKKTEGGFRNLPHSPSYPEIPYPTPSNLGFPPVGSFFSNFEKSVEWDGELGERTKREADPNLLPGHGQHHPHHPAHEEHLVIDHDGHITPVALVRVPTPAPLGGHHVTISTPTHHISHGILDHGTHHAVHKEHHQVHGEDYHVPHEAHHAPLEAHHAPHPVQHAPHEAHHPQHEAHHVPHDIHHSQKTVSHGLPILIESKGDVGHYTPTPHHSISGYPKPAHGGTLEEIFGVGPGYSPAPYHPTPAPYHPTPAPYHPVHPAYHNPEPAYHPPTPAYHAPPTPAYHPPEPAYAPPTPVYHAPEPAYAPPTPAYHAPEPAYAPPTPAYHAPEPAYAPPTPAYHAPEPAYAPPAPAYHAPEPAYAPPTPAYHVPEYAPDFKHPTGDYIPPTAKMAGHPFSLEHVFGIPMPNYYMEKYPHMAQSIHHPDHHVVDTYAEPAPFYDPPKVYDHPVSGYPKPEHGASLEEIFGVPTKYHPVVKPSYHEPEHHIITVMHPPELKYVEPKPEYHAPKPEYHAPKPEYHAPKPEYHIPKPEYHAPKPEYHAPKPEYHAPKPEYHAPKPEYHVPKPEYHAPKPEYHAPEPVYHESGHGYAPPHNGGSLEEIFGIGSHPLPSVYVTPKPDYYPTTYKPKMPEYVNKDYKSLPDPGYVLHYLPYDDYQPHHQKSIDHPPPVPHHPGAAHILVPGNHPLPPPDLFPSPLSAHPDVKSLTLFRGARVKRSESGQFIQVLKDTVHLADNSVDFINDEESQLHGSFNTSDFDLCIHLNTADRNWKPCLLSNGNITGLVVNAHTSLASLANLPKNNFLPSDGNHLSLSVNSASHPSPSIHTFPLLLSLPGSVPTTPSWRFPTEGTTKPTQDWFSDSSQPTTVYFDPRLSTTPAPMKSSGNFEKLTKNMISTKLTTNTPNLLLPGSGSKTNKDAISFFISKSNPKTNIANSVDSKPMSNHVLAATKEELLRQIKEKGSQLEKQRLLHQIRLKENQLQKLLAGIDQNEFKVPDSGTWKIQSQVLDGKDVPAGEWIIPSSKPDRKI